MGKLSADEVVATIRDHVAGGGDVVELRRDEVFYRSARRRFESWLNACEAAGVSVKRVRRWTSEKVIEAILKRQADGLDLHKTWQEDQSLNGAARHHFGYLAGGDQSGWHRTDPDRTMEQATCHRTIAGVARTRHRDKLGPV